MCYTITVPINDTSPKKKLGVEGGLFRQTARGKCVVSATQVTLGTLTAGTFACPLRRRKATGGEGSRARCRLRTLRCLAPVVMDFLRH